MNTEKMMNRNILVICIILLLTGMDGLAQNNTRLIMRGDDIASTHGANLGCIQSYKEGIMQTVEIMVPCPWFPEAVKMLKEVPGLDVGVHITLTSEWENIKWGPISHAPSLTDEDGYFYPQIWPSKKFPKDRTIKGADWKLEEIEAEMRAQIELAVKYIPQVSHLSCHMGCTSIDKQVAELFTKLASEYELNINPLEHQVNNFPGRIEGETSEQRIDSFIAGLEKMKAGKTYLFVEHPAIAGNEMEAVGHDGYYTVNDDRQMVTEMFTSSEVKKAIEKLEIELISYADLVE
jgi:chitin disaccharide deacetylase